MAGAAISRTFIHGAVVLMATALWGQSSPTAPPDQPPAAAKPVIEASTPAVTPAQGPQAGAPAAESIRQVKRIYIDSFGDDLVSKQIQSMVVTELTDSKRFIVTENKEKADAFLRGAALEKTSQEFHSYNSETAAGSAGGYHSGNVNGSWNDAGGSVHGSSSGGFHSTHAAIADSNASTETINDARISVRLVNRDGDVLWATTQESHGAKYKGASADVAEQVVKQLLRDLDKQSKQPQVPVAAPATADPKK